MMNFFKLEFKADSHLKELLMGSSVAFLFKIGGLAFGYVLIVIITNRCGVEAMGIYMLSLTVLQIVSVLGRVGTDTLFLRYTGEYASKKNGKIIIKNILNKILLVTIPLSILISFALFFSVPFISEYIFRKPDLVFSLEIVSFGILPMVLFFIYSQGLRGLKKIPIYAFLTYVAIALFTILILLILLLYSSSNNLPIYAQVVAINMGLIITFIAWRYYLKEIGSQESISNLHENKISIINMLYISLPMMLASSLYMILNWTDNIILGIFRSSEEVGIYGVSLKIALLTTLPLIAINSISAPKFAEMWGKKDLISLKKIVHQSSKMLFWGSLPLFIILISYPEWLLGLFGEKFELGVTVLILLAIGQFFNTISGSVGILLSMTGHQVILQNILLFSIIVNVVLNLLLVKDFGMIGVAIATMTSTIMSNGLMNYYIWKKLGFITLNIGLNK